MLSNNLSRILLNSKAKNIQSVVQSSATTSKMSKVYKIVNKEGSSLTQSFACWLNATGISSWNSVMDRSPWVSLSGALRNVALGGPIKFLMISKVTSLKVCSIIKYQQDRLHTWSKHTRKSNKILNVWSALRSLAWTWKFSSKICGTTTYQRDVPKVSSENMTHWSRLKKGILWASIDCSGRNITIHWLRKLKNVKRR